MKNKLLLFLLILLGIGGSTFAQGIRLDATTVQEMSTTAIPGTTNVLTVPAAPIVKFCNFPANAVPCTNLATTFTTSTLGTPCNTSTQITLVGSTTCVASPDANGNFGFWAVAGNYAYTVTLPGGINLGPYNVTLGIPSGTNLPAVTVGKWNSIISVDGTTFTTCDLAQTAAIAQAGSGTALVIVPSTSASVCSADNVKVQVWYFNGTIDPSIRSGVSWNNTSATPIHSYVRFQDNDPSPAGSSVGAYFVHRFNGVMPTANAMDAISPEVQTTGSITSWGATAALQASENVCTIASTGSTISQVFCTVSYMRGAALSTTNVTNAFGFYAPTMVNSGTGVWTNIYGAVFDVQNAGIGNNLSWWAKGATETDGQASFLCSGTVPCISLRADTISNNNAMEIQDTHAGGHNWWLGEQNNVTVFSLVNRTQTNRPSWGFQVTGSTAAEGRFVHANTGNRTYTFPDATGTVAFNPPAVAGTTDLGTTALPFGNLWLGTAATNNFKFQPAATAAARVISMPDPLTNVNLAFNLTATSAAFATATTAATCVQNTTAVAGAATTMVAEVSPVTTPGVGAVWAAFVSSAGNVTINECAVAASAGGSIAFNIRVHP